MIENMAKIWASQDVGRIIGLYDVDIQERAGGSDDSRFVTLPACLLELISWVKQLYNEVDPEFNVPMGDYFEGFINDEARQMGKTIDEIRAWEPLKWTRGMKMIKKKARVNEN